MKKPIKNMEQAVRSRLMQLSKETGQPFNFLTRLYMQQGLLNRLVRSAYSEYFILKGGLFLFSRIGYSARPTQDIDFLGRSIPNSEERIRQAFEEIVQIEFDDGLRFDMSTLEISRIIQSAEYPGQQVKIVCHLGNTRDYIWIDIGFGDVIIPRRQIIKFPQIVDLVEPPEIYCYSIDSAVAEKLQTAVKNEYINGRMKDFYDIYTFIGCSEFDGQTLQEAIKETFSHRGTGIERELVFFQEEFHSDPAILERWRAFLKRINKTEPTLAEALDTIQFFLTPLWDKLCRDDDFFGRWDYKNQHWESVATSVMNDAPNAK
jgi:predicted nucleotidyltransferase component of viral defense system